MVPNNLSKYFYLILNIFWKKIAHRFWTVSTRPAFMETLPSINTVLFLNRYRDPRDACHDPREWKRPLRLYWAANIQLECESKWHNIYFSSENLSSPLYKDSLNKVWTIKNIIFSAITSIQSQPYFDQIKFTIAMLWILQWCSLARHWVTFVPRDMFPGHGGCFADINCTIYLSLYKLWNSQTFHP